MSIIKQIVESKSSGIMIMMSFVLISVGNQIVLVPQENYHPIGKAIFVLGAIIMILGVLSYRTTSITSKIDQYSSWLQRNWDISFNQLLFIIVGLISSSVVYIFSGEGVIMRNLSSAIIFWLGGMLLVLLGVIEHQNNQFNLEKKDWIWFLGISIVGIAFRLYQVDAVPIVLTGDEGSIGLSALNFAQGNADNIFGIGWFSFPAFFYFIQGIGIRIFGQSILGLRFFPAVVGGITCGVTYLLGSKFFNRSVGIFAGIYLIGQHFYFHFSRLGLNNIWDSLWFVLTLLLVWVAVNQNRRLLFILAGISLGLSQFFYVSARMLVIVIVIWTLYLAFWDRDLFNSNRTNFMTMGLVFLVVVLPMAIYYLTHAAEFMAPYNRVKISAEWLLIESRKLGIPPYRIIFNNFITNLKIFTITTPTHWYYPGVGLIRGLAVPFFYLGLIIFIFKIFANQKIILLIWGLAILLPSALSLPLRSSQRLIAIAPLLAILVGIGLSKLHQIVSDIFPKQKNMLMNIIILLSVAITFSDINFYWNDYTPRSNLGGENTRVANRLAEYLQDYVDDGAQVAFWGFPRMGYQSISTLPYLASHVEGVNMQSEWGSTDNPLLSANEIVFIMLPGFEDYQASVLQAFPGGEFQPIYRDDLEVLYWQYHYQE